MATLKPIGNRVVIRFAPEKTRTTGGLFLAGEDPSTTRRATIVAVSDQVAEDLKVGDEVLTYRNAGQQELPDGTFTLDVEHVLAVLRSQ